MWLFRTGSVMERHVAFEQMKQFSVKNSLHTTPFKSKPKKIRSSNPQFVILTPTYFPSLGMGVELVVERRA